MSGHRGGNQPATCPHCIKTTTSLENVFSSLIESYGFKVIQRYRPKFLEGKEIDIFLPDLNIGFEINGAYTHNSSFSPFGDLPKPMNYHASKSDKCAKAGIKLFHIWEHWGRQIQKDLILSKLGIFTSKIGARKLKFNSSPDKRRLRAFLSKYHALGYANASFNFTLELDGDIIQAIQFKRSSVDGVVILSRNASKAGVQVVGGFNKLMSHAISFLKDFHTIETFAIRDLTPNPLDSCYARYGFTLIGDSGPTLFYWVSKPLKIGDNTYIQTGFKSRNQLMKSKLEEKGLDFEGKSEAKKLAELGIYRVYNSGCWKFELKLK
jgi:hypothetical protein